MGVLPNFSPPVKENIIRLDRNENCFPIFCQIVRLFLLRGPGSAQFWAQSCWPIPGDSDDRMLPPRPAPNEVESAFCRHRPPKKSEKKSPAITSIVVIVNVECCHQRHDRKEYLSIWTRPEESHVGPRVSLAPEARCS